MSNVLGLIVGFNIRTALWLQRVQSSILHQVKLYAVSSKATREDDDGKFHRGYCIFLILDFFFICNLGT
jgi:hypothetical protein